MTYPLVYAGILPIILGKGSEATGSRARRDDGMKMCHAINFAALHTHVGGDNGKHRIKLYLFTYRDKTSCFLYWLFGFATATSCDAHNRSRPQWQPQPQIQIQARLPELPLYYRYCWNSNPSNFLVPLESLFYMQKEKREGCYMR